MCLAVPGRVIEIVGDGDPMRTARVSFAGLIKPVSLALVPEAVAGDYVLVHAGCAITVLDEREAAVTLGYLEEMGRAAPATG